MVSSSRRLAERLIKAPSLDGIQGIKLKCHFAQNALTS